MRLTVHGSRTLADERVEIILREEIQEHGITHLVTHGEPGGVCEVARKLAKRIPMPLTLHYLNFQKLRGAFEHRSKAVLNDGDRAIFIHDGKSKGTSNELKMAQKMKIPYSFHELEISEHKKSVGFDEGWEVDMPEPPEIEIPEVTV